MSVDVPTDSTAEASEIQADGSNALTGTTTPNLSSQTLQALLDLTQQDPGTDPSQASQTGQTQTGQSGGAHRHHGHHHGGGMIQAQLQPQSGSSSQASAMTTVGDGEALTASDADDTSEASLASALMNA